MSETDRAAQLYEEAVAAYGARDLSKARASALEALAIFERYDGPDAPDVANVHILLGRNEGARGRYSVALQHLERAVAIAEPLLSFGEEAGTMLFVQAMTSRGETLRYLGRHREAEPILERALTVARAELGPDHLDTAAALVALGILHQTEGQLPRAGERYAEARRILEQAYGPDDPPLASLLQHVGGLALARGAVDEAEALFGRILPVFEAAHGRQHYDVAVTLGNLGAVCQASGRQREAQAYVQEALAIFEAILGPSHPDVALTLHALASVLVEAGRVDEARPLLARATEIYETTVPREHEGRQACAADRAALDNGSRPPGRE